MVIDCMDCTETSKPTISAPEPRQNWALFLDIDGTLIDIKPSPEAVEVPATLPSVLERARDWLGGALAVVSGRPIGQIDALMAPLKLPCAGEHGAVLRKPDGSVVRPSGALGVPRAWMAHAKSVAGQWKGVLVEDKDFVLSVHYRQAPESKDDVHALLQSIVAADPEEFEILTTKMGFEIRHRHATKAAAVTGLMDSEPFAGRIPVFIGDDVTDEDGFRAARKMGGLGLHVAEAFGGHASCVREWLRGFGGKA